MKVKNKSANTADIWEEKKKKKVDFSDLFNKTLIKDTARTVKKSFPRFVSIIAIVALGISVFAGMKATAPDMIETAQQYYSDTNLMDLCVQSTIGLEDADIAAISAVSGVESVMPVKTVDSER